VSNYNPVVGRDPWTSLATFSADSADPTYPASNLGTSDLNQVYRATAKSAVITFVLSRPVPVGLVVLVRHGLTQGATFRLELFSDTGLETLKYDSSTDADLIGGGDIWPTTYTFNQLDFEDDNWLTWQPRTDEIQGKPWDRPIWLNDTRYLIQSGRLTVSNPFAPSNVQIGRLEICRGQQLSRGIPVQAQSGSPSNSVVTPADGGKEYGQRKQKGRVFQATFPTLPRAEAELLKEIKDQHDIVPEAGLYWHAYPKDPTLWIRNSFYARNAELGLHQIAAPLRDSVPLSLREIL
jgi:hypothetical protein